MAGQIDWINVGISVAVFCGFAFFIAQLIAKRLGYKSLVELFHAWFPQKPSIDALKFQIEKRNQGLKM